MFLDYWEAWKAVDEKADWEELVIVKMDLRAAFTLLFFMASACHLMVTELTGGLALIYICGLFGWCNTPAAFQVATRTFAFEVKVEYEKSKRANAVMYVDDMLGITRGKWVSWFVGWFTALACNLLGSRAISPDKTEYGRRIDAIGWTVDLDQRTFSIARKNLLKALYGFMHIGDDWSVSLRELQRLCSWATRYGAVHRAMLPYTTLLYSETVGRSKANARIVLGEEARRAVEMWRRILILGTWDEKMFTRSLESFRKKKREYMVESDASLEGVGFRLWRLNKKGEVDNEASDMLGGAAVSFGSLVVLKKSDYQNCAELIGHIVGLEGIAAVMQLGNEVRRSAQGDAAIHYVTLLRDSRALECECSYRARRGSPAGGGDVETRLDTGHLGRIDVYTFARIISQEEEGVHVGVRCIPRGRGIAGVAPE
jgi:hypothetical protein